MVILLDPVGEAVIMLCVVGGSEWDSLNRLPQFALVKPYRIIMRLIALSMQFKWIENSLEGLNKNLRKFVNSSNTCRHNGYVRNTIQATIYRTQRKYLGAILQR